MPFRFLLFLAIFVSVGLYEPLAAQSHISLSGQVKDADTGKPLPYAGLYISGSSLGAVCDKNGTFSLSVPNKYKNNNLIISFLGYQSKQLPLQQIYNKHIVIKLAPEDENIETVTVRPGLAEGLIAKALDKIPENYPKHALQQQASYRETVRQNGEYIEHIELILEIYKTAYNSRKADQIKALSGKRADSLTDSYLYEHVYFVNGPYEALACDIAKYPDDFITLPRNLLNFLNLSFFKFYRYELLFAPPLSEQYFIIRFIPKHKRAVYAGSLLLERKTLAFRALYYKTTPPKTAQTPLMPLRVDEFLASRELYVTPKHYECYTEYIPTENGMEFKRAYLEYSYYLFNRKKNQTDTIYYNSLIEINKTLNKPASTFGLWERFMWDTDIRMLLPRKQSFNRQNFFISDKGELYHFLKEHTNALVK